MASVIDSQDGTGYKNWQGVGEGGGSVAEGRIPEEWQQSKVVFIPKPNKDHQVFKGWRPINLINYIGKLAEKVVADEFQEARLFHRGQYGGKGTIGTGSHDADVDEGTKRDGTDRKSVV